MNAPTLHPVPGSRAVLREQFSSTGLSMKAEIGVIVGIMAVVTAVVAGNHLYRGSSFDFSVELALPTVLAGLFAPMAVWKGEEPARRSYFWAMPVSRTRHTLMRVFGGWVWVMVLISVYILWAMVLAFITGGEFGVEEMRLLVGEIPAGGRPTAEDYYIHRQATPVWQWLVPFTGATATYLIGSIVVLASDHPWRWFAAVFFTYMLFMVLSAAADLRWLGQATNSLYQGRYGLEVLLTGSVDESVMVVSLGGRTGRVWLDQPRFDLWATATLMWNGLALMGVLAFARRFQER